MSQDDTRREFLQFWSECSEKLDMGKLSFSFAVWLVALALLSSCSKVDPEIFALGSKKDPDTGGGTPQNPAPPGNRLTLGSNSAVVSNGGYKLKGRVSFIEPSQSVNGSYKLKGTVRF